jgi:hypothetical protein
MEDAGAAKSAIDKSKSRPISAAGPSPSTKARPRERDRPRSPSQVAMAVTGAIGVTGAIVAGFGGGRRF